jgi:hypothetical protein
MRDFIVVAIVMAAIAGGLQWQWENLQFRMESDYARGVIGSGRSSFYRLIASEWYNGSDLSLLFGKGFFTVPDTLERYGTKIYAHSDWLEILHDMGLIGVALFAYLHFCILLVVRQALRQRDLVAPALTMGYCIFALRNIYSQCVVGSSDTIYFALLLGYSAAVLRSRQNTPFFRER